MKLYPLGQQRDLKTDFDKVDFYGLHWGEGRLRTEREHNRRYNGLYVKYVGDERWVYYYDFCGPDVDSFERERIYNKGYSKTELAEGKQHPLYICFDIYVHKEGTYKKVCAERELLPQRVAKILLKDYLDPYYHKPNMATKKVFKSKQRSDLYE